MLGSDVKNIAYYKITSAHSACIAQMVCTLNAHFSAISFHCRTFRTSCSKNLATLDAVLAHRVLRLVQVVDTLRKIRHANELQIRLAQFDSGSRLHQNANVACCNFAKRNIAHRSTLFAHFAPCNALATGCASRASRVITQRCCALFAPPCWAL